MTTECSAVKRMCIAHIYIPSILKGHQGRRDKKNVRAILGKPDVKHLLNRTCLLYKLTAAVVPVHD